MGAAVLGEAAGAGFGQHSLQVGQSGAEDSTACPGLLPATVAVLPSSISRASLDGWLQDQSPEGVVPSPGGCPEQTCCSALLFDLENKKSLMLCWLWLVFFFSLFFFFPLGCCVAGETSAPGVPFPFLPAALN